ncbi:MAG: hypothetical protein K2O24_00860 [Muribaculaceae bacterium]|nr:hypothetical protein [Muribaculaceae bacterium]
MKQDDKFDARLSEWLDSEAPDPLEGIELLYSLTGNAIQRRRLRTDPAGTAAFVRSELRRRLDYRLNVRTREEFRRLQSRAEEAVVRHLDASAPEGVRKSPYGLRPDHESLPREIRELFDINMQARRRMAECHLQIRHIWKTRPKCLESELYPWVKEIIRLDKESLERWSRYDNFKP